MSHKHLWKKYLVKNDCSKNFLHQKTRKLRKKVSFKRIVVISKKTGEVILNRKFKSFMMNYALTSTLSPENMCTYELV